MLGFADKDIEISTTSLTKYTLSWYIYHENENTQIEEPFIWF